MATETTKAADSKALSTATGTKVITTAMQWDTDELVKLLGLNNAQQVLMLEGYAIDQSGKLQWNGGSGGGFGGSSVNGQGKWINTYGTQPGINGATYY